MLELIVIYSIVALLVTAFALMPNEQPPWRPPF